MKTIRLWLAKLGNHASKPWYPLALAALAASDQFVMVLPLDGIIVTSMVSAPKRWLRLSVWSAIGCTVGAVLLFFLVRAHGMSVIEFFLPGLPEKPAWAQASRWMDQYGLWAIFIVSIFPLAQPPVVALSALAGTPILVFTSVLALGKILKYLFFGWMASKSPHLLMKSKSIRKEVYEVTGPPPSKLDP
jgi:membrane protein YqaA with SNARE-associated domain